MKALTDRFAEVEKRVKSLVAENAELRHRASALEQELASARAELQGMGELRGRKLEIREKIERALRALEEAGGQKQPD